MNKPILTEKQHAVYEFVKHFIREQGFAPTTTEIGAGQHINIKSKGVVHRHLSALANAGLIRLVRGRRRNIELLFPYEDDEIPITGTIAAGKPIQAIERHESLNLSEQLLGQHRFILKVSGDSMIGDNICDGDLIICEETQTVNKNDIAIVLIDGEEATLKRIQNNEDGSVTLIPSNPRLSPMAYDANRIQIQGRYIGLIRMPG